jgi:hypothetical protein
LQGINGRQYFHSNLNLKDPSNGNYNVYKYDIINQLVLNECYLANFDKYKHIAVLDVDEVIFPKKTRLFTFQDEMAHIIRLGSIHNTKLIQKEQIFDKVQCDRYQNESKSAAGLSKNDLESYLNELNSVSLKYSSKPKSLYFGQAFFLHNDLVQSIFRSINYFFTTTKFNHTVDNFNFTIHVAHRDASLKNRRTKFKITISDQREFEYAKGLLKIHRYIIKPYLSANRSLMFSLTQNFNRFFMIAGRVNDFSLGKTIHDTNRTFEVTLHHPFRFIDNESWWWSSSSPVILGDPNHLNATTAQSYRAVPYELGHVSHFRNFLLHDYKSVPISSLRLDLNYVNCYFSPTVSKFASDRDKLRLKNQNKFVNRTKKDF